MKKQKEQKAFSLLELMAAVAIIAILAAIAVPAYNNMVLDQKINSTTKDLVTIIQLAKNHSSTRNMGVAICADNLKNNCLHTENWSETGANLLGFAFTKEGTRVEKTQGPDEEYEEEIQVPADPNNTTVTNPYVVDSNDPVVKSLLRMVRGSKKTSAPKRGSISNDVAIQCRDVNRALAGYAAGYLKYTGGSPSFYPDLSKFVSTGKGKLTKTKERYNPPLYWGDEVMHVTETWESTDGKGIKIKVWDGDNEDELLNGGHFYGMCFTEWKDLDSYTSNKPDPPKFITKKVKKTRPTYITKTVQIPAKLVFNPIKDATNNWIDGEEKEGIIHRFSEIQKSNIEINSAAQTLIFLSNNSVNKISPSDANKIEPITSGAVITVSDAKRGISAKSKQICINVFGSTTVINGNEECKF